MGCAISWYALIKRLVFIFRVYDAYVSISMGISPLMGAPYPPQLCEMPPERSQAEPIQATARWAIPAKPRQARLAKPRPANVSTERWSSMKIYSSMWANSLYLAHHCGLGISHSAQLHCSRYADCPLRWGFDVFEPQHLASLCAWNHQWDVIDGLIRRWTS